MLITPETIDALTVIWNAVTRLESESKPWGKCSCGDERRTTASHYPWAHLHGAAKYLVSDVFDEERSIGDFPPDATFQVYGTPWSNGRITEVCIGGAGTEDAAFDLARAWLRRHPSGGAYIFHLRGYAHVTHPFDLLEAETKAAEARRLLGCE